jgi:hypothetical protein
MDKSNINSASRHCQICGSPNPELWCTTPENAAAFACVSFGRASNKIVEIEGKEIIVQGCLGLSDAEVLAKASRGRYLDPKQTHIAYVFDGVLGRKYILNPFRADWERD